MAETPSTPVASPTTLSPIEQARKKLQEARTFFESFSGKPTYNPWFIITSTIVPLEKRLKTGESGDTIVKEINAIKLELKPYDTLIEAAKVMEAQKLLKPNLGALPPRG